MQIISLLLSVILRYILFVPILWVSRVFLPLDKLFSLKVRARLCWFHQSRFGLLFLCLQWFEFLWLRLLALLLHWLTFRVFLQILLYCVREMMTREIYRGNFTWIECYLIMLLLRNDDSKAPLIVRVFTFFTLWNTSL